MYSVLNPLSEYAYFYISKNITSYTFLTVSKIIESHQQGHSWRRAKGAKAAFQILAKRCIFVVALK